MMLTMTQTGSKKTKALPRAIVPKFVDNKELCGPKAYEQLFEDHEPRQTTLKPTNYAELQRFKQMHFSAKRMKALVARCGAGAEQQPEYRRFAQLHKQLSDQIASDNLGLVYDLYKRTRIANVDGDELLSEGMMALTRAMATFNPWRGFRFSTYACNAIIRAFYRCGLKESKRRRHEAVNFDAELERSDWDQTCRTETGDLYLERLSKILAEGKVELNEIERDVLGRRFPLHDGTKRQTLSSIGRKMRLSKERVRQIQNTALGKLREALELDPALQ